MYIWNCSGQIHEFEKSSYCASNHHHFMDHFDAETILWLRWWSSYLQRIRNVERKTNSWRAREGCKINFYYAFRRLARTYSLVDPFSVHPSDLFTRRWSMSINFNDSGSGGTHRIFLLPTEQLVYVVVAFRRFFFSSCIFYQTVRIYMKNRENPRRGPLPSRLVKVENNKIHWNAPFWDAYGNVFEVRVRQSVIHQHHDWKSLSSATCDEKCWTLYM